MSEPFEAQDKLKLRPPGPKDAGLPGKSPGSPQTGAKPGATRGSARMRLFAQGFQGAVAQFAEMAIQEMLAADEGHDGRAAVQHFAARVL